MAIRPSDDKTFRSVSIWVEDVARCFLDNGLLLDPAKTKEVLLVTKVQQEKILTASGTDVAGRTDRQVVDVTLDSARRMERYVSEVYAVATITHVNWGIYDRSTDDIQRNQDGWTQYRVFLPGLCQRTAALYISQQPQQAIYIGGIEWYVPLSASTAELRQQLHWSPVR